MIHAPNSLLADLGDEPPQMGRLKVLTQPSDELSESLRILSVLLRVEHVVFALMPKDSLQLVTHTTSIQLL